MPTYALLGATGAAGSSVLRCLLAEPPKALSLSILVRSKAKLLKLFPHLEETSSFSLKIVEGDSTDSAALQNCLAGSDVIITCVATNDSRPDTSIAYDTAAAIIDALKSLQNADQPSSVSPTILQLRAAPVNPTIKMQMPAPVRFMLWFSLHYCYADLQKAAELYAQAAKETTVLLDYIYIDPGALHDAGGSERTGHKLCYNERLKPMLSYADLGAGICELAERREEFKGKGVGISSTGKVRMTWSANVGYMVNGLKNRFLHLLGVV